MVNQPATDRANFSATLRVFERVCEIRISILILLIISHLYLPSWLADQVANVTQKVARDAPDGQPLKDLISGLKKKYSVPGAPFDVLLPTGSGTFEGYVGWGAGCGASADGRRSGSPVASDIGAAPTPLDKPATAKSSEIYK